MPGKKQPPPDWDALEAAGNPLLLVESGVPKHAMLKFGKNPLNAHKNALPKGIRGVRIWHYFGDDPPVKRQLWTHLADVKESPYFHEPGNTEYLVISYMVAYIDRYGRPGISSKPGTTSVFAKEEGG